MKIGKKNGSILILALWTMMFLTFFSVQISLRIQQRASILKKIEQRSQLRFAADSGVKKAISALKLDLQNNQAYTPQGKAYRHNNKEIFADIPVGEARSQIVYFEPGTSSGILLEKFGLVDEESKLNINTAEYAELQNLIFGVTGVTEEDAKLMTLAILEWREFGKTELTGFYSDNYYQMLEFPYTAKNAHFEVLDELFLVRGFNQDRFERLLPFITIYGDGQINVNTASRNVFLALGIPIEIVDKLLVVRRGLDGLESTEDDHIFLRTFDVASEIAQVAGLNTQEAKIIDYFNQKGKFKTSSQYYRIQSRGELLHDDVTLMVMSVYNVKENKIEYWKEI